jgi:hypothetical protein
MRDLFGIALVHLTAIRLDEEFRHGRKRYTLDSPLPKRVDDAKREFWGAYAPRVLRLAPSPIAGLMYTAIALRGGVCGEGAANGTRGAYTPRIMRFSSQQLFAIKSQRL